MQATDIYHIVVVSVSDCIGAEGMTDDEDPLRRFVVQQQQTKKYLDEFVQKQNLLVQEHQRAVESHLKGFRQPVVDLARTAFGPHVMKSGDVDDLLRAVHAYVDALEESNVLTKSSAEGTDDWPAEDTDEVGISLETAAEFLRPSVTEQTFNGLASAWSFPDERGEVPLANLGVGVREAETSWTGVSCTQGSTPPQTTNLEGSAELTASCVAAAKAHPEPSTTNWTLLPSLSKRHSSRDSNGDNLIMLGSYIADSRGRHCTSCPKSAQGDGSDEVQADRKIARVGVKPVLSHESLNLISERGSVTSVGVNGKHEDVSHRFNRFRRQMTADAKQRLNAAFAHTELIVEGRGDFLFLVVSVSVSVVSFVLVGLLLFFVPTFGFEAKATRRERRCDPKPRLLNVRR